MTTFVKKMAMREAKKRLGNQVTNQERHYQDDFNYYVDKDKQGKVRKAKKDLKYYTEKKHIPEKDAKILMSVRKRAKRMDKPTVCGMRLPTGWTAVAGSVPVVGDFADTALAWFFVVRKAEQISKGKDKLALSAVMYRNLSINFGLGITPMLGDIALALFRCNIRNANALEAMLVKRAEKAQLLAEKEGRVPAQGPMLEEAYFGDEPALGVSERYEATPATRRPARDNSEAPPTAPRPFDKRYGGMHERLAAKATKLPATATEAPRNENRWFGANKKRGREKMGGVDVVPARPARPGNTINLGDMTSDQGLPPQQPRRPENTRHVNGAHF